MAEPPSLLNLQQRCVRIPFPERVSLPGVAVFASALFVVQQLEGTALYFSAGCVAFILIAAFGFNLGGGLARTAGAYIFFYSLLVFIVGVTYKAYLGEPGETNLSVPKIDILVYLGGISGMAAAAFLSKKLARRTPLLKNVLDHRNMYRASVGCMVVGSLGGLTIALMGEAGLRLNAAFTQLNLLIPLGIILGVIYEIKESGGTRSVNFAILIGGGYAFLFYGITNFSKQGMLTPLLCWILPVCALRYRMSLIQILSVAGGVFLIFFLLVPYAQYGRRFLRPEMTSADKMALAYKLLSKPTELRSNFEEDPGIPTYYNTAQGFWDRLQFISVDDPLVDITHQGRKFGYSPLLLTAGNVIPHFIWPDKPSFNLGNTYAHELGHMNPYDFSTGISFSPTAEAYHLDGWRSLLVVAPMLWLMLFVVYDTVFGDLRSTPWGLLVLAQLTHSAPEGALNGTIYLVTFGIEIVVFCAYFAAWIAPYFAILALGPPKPLQPEFIGPPTPVQRTATLNPET